MTNRLTRTLTEMNRYSISKGIGYWPLVGVWLSAIGFAVSFYSFIPFVFFTYFLFRNTLNVLQVVGPVYWIAKETTSKASPMVAKGFMHETSYPWRSGKGLQVRWGFKTFQVGICHKQNYDETEGMLSAVQGRFMDLTPIEIREQSKKLKGDADAFLE